MAFNSNGGLYFIEMRATTVSIASAVVRWVGRIAGVDYSEAARISRGSGGAGVGMFIPNTVGRISHIPNIRRAATRVRREITTTNDWLLTYSTYKKELAKTSTLFLTSPLSYQIPMPSSMQRKLCAYLSLIHI